MYTEIRLAELLVILIAYILQIRKVVVLNNTTYRNKLVIPFKSFVNFPTYKKNYSEWRCFPTDRIM